MSRRFRGAIRIRLVMPWLAPDESAGCGLGCSHLEASGQEITDAMIERWCDAYERGEFPEGERTVGGVVMGRPPMSADKTVTVGVKMPSGMKAALASKAKQRGMTMSAYAREVLASDLRRLAK